MMRWYWQNLLVWSGKFIVDKKVPIVYLTTYRNPSVLTILTARTDVTDLGPIEIESITTPRPYSR